MLLPDTQITDLCTARHVLTAYRAGQKKQIIDASNNFDYLAAKAFHFEKHSEDLYFSVDKREDHDYSMISPFEPGLVRKIEDRGVISFGLSSYGYDVRIAPVFKIFTPVHSSEIDPKGIDDSCFVEVTLGEGDKDYILIPPNSFVLAHSVEYFKMPANVTGLVLGKSTYARAGVNCLATPLEAGWEGQITLEYANTTPLPVRLYANEGAAQVLFMRGDDICKTSYADRAGKYQGQTGITLPTA